VSLRVTAGAAADRKGSLEGLYVTESGGDSPILSIIVATWNRISELRTMLESLLPQITGELVELVVVDDCSTDTTWEWIGANLKGLPNVRCLRMDSNSGPGPARNLGLTYTRGHYFVPIDSDFVVVDGGIDRILVALSMFPLYKLLFFPSIRYPGMQRLDCLSGRAEITYEQFLTADLGEMLPVAEVAHIRASGLAFASFRSGGESLLWGQILSTGPALFLDTPVTYYRTDSPHRICTLEHQVDHPSDLADISDALVASFPANASAGLRRARAQKQLAAGTYHLLAGNVEIGRARLISAVSEGCWTAIPTLAISFVGQRMFRVLFRLYRKRLRKTYFD
jgi:glycosyltransferase involved in cell wall biosynthesis